MKNTRNKVKAPLIRVRVTVGFDDLSARTFVQAPHAMWRPQLQKEDKQQRAESGTKTGETRTKKNKQKKNNISVIKCTLLLES